MEERVSMMQEHDQTALVSEDQLILAYRYFTHGIITTNYLKLLEEVEENSQNKKDEKKKKQRE